MFDINKADCNGTVNRNLAYIGRSLGLQNILFALDDLHTMGRITDEEYARELSRIIVEERQNTNRVIF